MGPHCITAGKAGFQLMDPAWRCRGCACLAGEKQAILAGETLPFCKDFGCYKSFLSWEGFFSSIPYLDPCTLSWVARNLSMADVLWRTEEKDRGLCLGQGNAPSVPQGRGAAISGQCLLTHCLLFPVSIPCSPFPFLLMLLTFQGGKLMLITTASPCNSNGQCPA